MENLNVSNLKAVVFDWDNTLAQSRDALVASVNVVLKKYDLPSWDEVKSKRNNNLSFEDNFPIIFGKNAHKAYQLYRQIYVQIVPNLIKRTRYAYPVLNFFKKRNIPICLMTNKDRYLLDFEMPLLFEAEYFSYIVCGHEAAYNKPHPEHLIQTLKPFLPNIKMQNVWVIGDSPQDSDCACSCGAKAIRIGADLWEEDKNTDKNCLFFDSFVDFYESLLLSNA